MKTEESDVDATTAIGFEARMDGPYERAIGVVTEVLKEHGFGILTEIDLKAAFAEKLGVEFRPYTILGACNPKLAHAALSAHPEVGLLLPCNVTVEALDDGSVLVRITDPEQLFAASGIEEDEAITPVVAQAHELLSKVAAAL